MTLASLTASEATRDIREGRISSVDLTKACLAQIDTTDAQIGAWAFLDSDMALAQAEAMDDLRRRGRPLGALHGVPVGIKDIFDTADMPTGLGSPAHTGRRPDADAAIVEKLREAGAVILGKTVTTPLAFASPSTTRNPHNPDYSPGGSSSGSAAGVAAGHMPLAIGTQTGGSVNRPASYCGTYGFKPTRGSVSRRGALQTSQTLDQVGGFARSLEDLALLTDVLTGYDAADSATHMRPKPRMLEGYRSETPVAPNFVYLDIAPFPLTDAMRGAMDELCEALDGQVDRLTAPEDFAGILRDQHTIHTYEFARNLDGNAAIDPQHTDDIMKDLVAQGRAVTDDAYAAARATVTAAEAYFAAFFNDYDAILCPSSPGEAPLLSEGTTGDAVCQKIWTLAGLPTLTLPLFEGDAGMPMGLQLVGAQEEDARLFRTARWLEDHLFSADNDGEDDDDQGET